MCLSPRRSYPRTISGRPKLRSFHANRSRSRRVRHPDWLPINSWPILRTKSISLASVSCRPEFSTPAAQHEPAPATRAQCRWRTGEISQIEVGPLKEVFDEFRAELGEMGGEEEDLETHYNLGIAFREMGLLDEAISEFQKVAKAAENGRKFPYVMQCYTLLGLAFMDRAQPSIAAMWYERALRLPGIETESILALRYDLGVAQESAGESDAALKSFSQVYAVNIDYRDVGERIAALQKTTR